MWVVLVYLITLAVALAGGYYLGTASKPPAPPAPAPKQPDQQPPALDPEFAAPSGRRLSVEELKYVETKQEPPAHRKLVVVAFNLPLKLKKNPETGTWEATWDNPRSVFGNFKALGSESMDVRFVGWPGVFVSKAEEEELEDLLEEMGCTPVFLDKEMYDSFFHGFCKGIMWPLMHYQTPTIKMNFAKDWDRLWQAYQAVNMTFANKITLVAEEDDDCIWVHNYHLLLVPSFIRKKTYRGKLGIFIHTPFPSSDLFRCLPSRSNVLRALLCADMIGFQTYDYARHFFSSLKRILDLEFHPLPGGGLGVLFFGRTITIRINHVGLPSQFLTDLSKSAVVAAQISEIKEKYPGRRLIVAVDDTDPLKGAVAKVQAFTSLFQRYPDYAETVTLVLVLFSASSSPEEQKAVNDTISAETEGLKKTYGDKVIDIIEGRSCSLERLVALYACSEVGFLSTYWDGLNICPFEYTLSQPASSPGALIISEFMGCSRALSGVSNVNPWRLEEVAEALHSSLNLSLEEKLAHHSQRWEYAVKHSFESWVSGFLEDLDMAAASSRDLNFVQVGWGSNVRLIGLHAGFTHLEEGEVVAAFRASKRRLLLLDYDGTLTEETNPQLAAPTEELLRYLHILSEDPHNLVFIISGRERKFLDLWFQGLNRLGLAAEKGVYHRWPNSKEWKTTVSFRSVEWMEEVQRLMQQYTERTDGSRIEPKESAIVWHYESADPEYGKMQANELTKYLEKLVANWPGIEVVKYDYNRLLEVKPRGINKGVTAQRIMKSIETRAELPQFVLCVGDDRSDEEMFLAITDHYKMAAEATDPGAAAAAIAAQAPPASGDEAVLTAPALFTCCVGIKPSAARFYLHNPQDVLSVLKSLSVVSARIIKRVNQKPELTSTPSGGPLKKLSTSTSRSGSFSG